MGWLRILRVARRDRMRNEVIREVLYQEETLVNKIKKKRLTWFGHVTRMDERRLPPRESALPYRRDSECRKTAKKTDR